MIHLQVISLKLLIGFSYIKPLLTESSHRIVESEGSYSSIFSSLNPEDKSYQSYPSGNYESYIPISSTAQTSSCAYNGLGYRDCIPISQCQSYMLEAARSCYAGDRSLMCGQIDGEIYVCCPRSQYGSIRQNSCGKTIVSGHFYRGLGAYPFIGRIGFKNANTGALAYPCTGSIISRRVVLTAAHCALAKADGHRLSSVRVGEFDTSTDPDCVNSGFCAPTVINHAISHVIIHPNYNSGQYHHDIALLVLKTPLNYTVSVQPVCLYPDKTNLVIGKRVTVAGWGKISSTPFRSSQLQFIDVPLTPWELCVKTYGTSGALESPKSIDGQWLCAGGEGKDACQGFGGAPLFFKDNDIYQQIGIMSFGSDNCGGVRIPSVYTAIAQFLSWIQDNSPVD